MEVTTEKGRLEVEFRRGLGKSEVRKLRQKGLIPGICYGAAEDPIAIALDPVTLENALDPEKRANTLIKMSVKGLDKKGARELTVMLRDRQRDVMKGVVIHADFLRVKLDQEVSVVVPLSFTGKSVGVKEGGTMHQVYRQMNVLCTPDKIPVKIEIDVEALAIGDALHVGDVTLPAGVRAGLDKGTTICTITAPKAEKSAADEAAEAAAAEGAVPAEGAAAAPAEGAAPAKGAAPKKEEAAADKKKK